MSGDMSVVEEDDIGNKACLMLERIVPVVIAGEDG